MVSDFVMHDPAAVRILLVDDHPVVRFGLAAIIGAQPDMMVVGEASCGTESIELALRHHPDIVLMDLRLPGMSGVEAIKAIRERLPDARFVVVTTYQGDEDIHRALEAGAHGYVLKGASHVELLTAIRTVVRGQRFIPPSVSTRLAGRPPGSELTNRELQVLELIVNGLSNREIASRLGITEGTVKWHVNVLLGQLKVTDRTQAAVAALQRGIVQL
ncbi:MAG: response regulator transcription factor [Bryobacteraceae bacterium]|jgi:DNA-binding NarL/FixJ family response regulator